MTCAISNGLMRSISVVAGFTLSVSSAVTAISAAGTTCGSFAMRAIPPLYMRSIPGSFLRPSDREACLPPLHDCQSGNSSPQKRKRWRFSMHKLLALHMGKEDVLVATVNRLRVLNRLVALRVGRAANKERRAAGGNLEQTGLFGTHQPGLQLLLRLHQRLAVLLF